MIRGLAPDNPLFKRVRLLRKKLKQIENLKLLARKLNSEEVAKIERQDAFRDELLDILTQVNESQAEEDLVEYPSSSDEELPPPTPQPLVEEIPSLREIDWEESNSKGDLSPKDREPPVKDKPSPTTGSQTKTTSAKEPTSPPPPHVDPIVALRRKWANRYFELIELAGHTDIIRGVDINKEFIVSGSRDTTVKLWNSVSGELLQNFGGHTGQVNAVKLVQSQDGGSVVVSGGEDCSVKFWNISTGAKMEEFYVYNPVTCFSLLGCGQYLVAGLDGGKLEIYDLHTTSSHLSYSVDTQKITSLASGGNTLAVAGDDGLVEVLELNGSIMKRLYSLDENITDSVRSIVVKGGHIILGDDEANIQNLHWKRNTASAMANHHTEFGVTDTLYKHADCLFSSAYDYDAGLGYINVRDMSVDKYEYITSISDPDILHILSLAVTSSCEGQDSGPISIVTGGVQLVLWREDLRRSSESVKCRTRRLLLADDQLHSEADDCEESSSGISDDEISDEEADEQSTGGWWCTLL